MKNLLLFVQIIYMAAAGSSATLNANLEHYWTMDETSGDLSDSIDGAADAWNENANPGTTTGIDGEAVTVTVDNYFDIATATMFPSTTFTLSFWVNPTSFTSCSVGCDPLGAPIFSSSQLTTGIDIYRPHGTTNVNFRLYPSGSTATITGDPLTTGSWHLIVVWFNDDTNVGGIQIDGGTSSTFTSGSFTRTSGSQYIPFNTTYGCTCAVDEMALWNGIVLENVERQLIWNSGAGRFYPFT